MDCQTGKGLLHGYKKIRIKHICYISFIILHCILRMQTYVTEAVPLMTLPISYLDIESLGRWRMASKCSQVSTEALVGRDWYTHIKENAFVHRCFECQRIRQLRKMFQCPSCCRFVCGQHVMACGLCESECCSSCASNVCVRC